MQANLVTMSANWNDDDRDTRVSFHSYSSSPKVEETQSVCLAVRDYFRDQKESLYTWTVENYNAELNKRINCVLPPPIIQEDEVQTSLPMAEEKPDQEEFNNEIMDNQIYKKSMYS